MIFLFNLVRTLSGQRGSALLPGLKLEFEVGPTHPLSHLPPSTPTPHLAQVVGNETIGNLTGGKLNKHLLKASCILCRLKMKGVLFSRVPYCVLGYANITPGFWFGWQLTSEFFCHRKHNNLGGACCEFWGKRSRNSCNTQFELGRNCAVIRAKVVAVSYGVRALLP